MTHPFNNPLDESCDTLDWDENEVRDLIRTPPLRFDDDGLPAGYDTEQLFGLDEIDLTGRFR